MKMRYTIYLFLLLLLFSMGTSAQPGEQAGHKQLRIVDTLSAAEKNNRNPILLRSEIDSLVSQYNASLATPKKDEPVTTTSNNNGYMLGGLIAIIALLGVVISILYRHQRKINRTIAGLQSKQKDAGLTVVNGSQPATKDRKGKVTVQSLETKISNLDAELHKLSKENEGLSRVIKEYNGIQHEYESLKHGIQKAYKVKNYPGYDKTKDETVAMQGVLDTENAVAAYAYEKFLKPILTITDANKNSPARINATDQEKLIDLLVSLSLLYIEYLYLRVNDLSIGGKMVERIQGLSKGNGLDASLLKKLNTEFGSRALVIKMALSKTGVRGLSYPVFDETNLNQ